MTKKTVSLFIIFFAVVSSYGQSTLSYSVSSPDLSKGNVQMILTLTVNDPVDSLLYIILPQKLKAVPLSIQKNNNNLWLRNSDKSPDKSGALSWVVANDSILVLRFFKGTIVSGDVAKIVCMAKYRGIAAQGDKIAVKTNLSNPPIADTAIKK